MFLFDLPCLIRLKLSAKLLESFLRNSCNQFKARVLINRISPQIDIHFTHFKINALLDSGSVRSILSAELSNMLKPFVVVKSVRNCSWKFIFLVAPRLWCPIILGSDFFLNTHLSLLILQGNYNLNCIRSGLFSLAKVWAYSGKPMKLPTTTRVSQDPHSHLYDENRMLVS